MKIAVPTCQGKSCRDFNRYEGFAIFTARHRQIEKTERGFPPGDNPAALLRWLKKNRVGMVIAGHIPSKVRQLLDAHRIVTIAGAPPADPRLLAEFYLMTGEEPAKEPNQRRFS